MDFILKSPSSYQEWKKYFLFRYKMLRKPMGLSRNSARDIQERASYHVMATNNSSDIIGVGRIHFIDSQKSQIRYMAVDQECRRNGVGKEILYLLEKHSIKNSRHEIILNARENAVIFYSNLGYEKLGEIDVGIQIKHFAMRKRIEHYPFKSE